MKSILLSIKPEWLAKILNGEKTIEVRKKFPKDYVGWVYLYCSKEHNWKELLIHNISTNLIFLNRVAAFYKDDHERTPYLQILNGKVVARFWCDKVEEITCRSICGEWESYTDTLGYSEISQASCLANIDIVHYLKGNNGFAIHISKLEIFDKPKWLEEFNSFQRAKAADCGFLKQCKNCGRRLNRCHLLKPITKAPQNYCWVEENNVCLIK